MKLGHQPFDSHGMALREACLHSLPQSTEEIEAPDFRAFVQCF